MIIHFTGCLLDSQILGASNEHVIAKLFFIIKDKPYECLIRQPHGSDHSFEEDPIEVEAPDRLKGKIDYGAFREVAEQYYRSLIGSTGRIFHIDNRSSNISIKNGKIWQ